MYFAWIDDTQWILEDNAPLNCEGLEVTILPQEEKQIKLFPEIDTGETFESTAISFSQPEKRTILEALSHFVTTLDHDDDRRALISDLEKKIERLGTSRPDNEL